MFKRFLLSMLLVCAVLASAAAIGQAFPSKPVRIIVPQTPGGASDALARIVGQKLGEKWGQPVLTDIRPRPGLTWYNSSKGAAKVMTKSMAMELAPDGIRVNLISPVMAPTGLLQDFMGVADTAEKRARFVSTTPLGRMCDPSDVANAALFWPARRPNS